MAQSFTPGPWSTVTTENGNFEVNSADSVVVVVLGSDEKSEPDARLIAAAPDLLAALGRAQAALNPLSGLTKRGSKKDAAYLESVRDDIRAAIAKATGDA